jgi:hypothetical protein
MSRVSHEGSNRGAVRSLYALQFEDWFRHLRAVGKDPAHDLRIISSQDLKNNGPAVVKDLLTWLGSGDDNGNAGAGAGAGAAGNTTIIGGVKGGIDTSTFSLQSIKKQW